MVGRVGDTDGFTLLELLVIVAVLSLLVVSVSLTVMRDDAPQTQDAASFREIFEQQHSQAVHGRQPLGLAFEAGGVRRMWFERASATRLVAGWQPAQNLIKWNGRVLFENAQFGLGSRISIGGAGSIRPDILFLPNTRTSRFSVLFLGTEATQRCTSDGWKGLECNGN